VVRTFETEGEDVTRGWRKVCFLFFTRCC